MSRMRSILVIPALALLLGTLSGAPAQSAEPKTSGPVFATVDVEKAFNNYDKKKTLDDQLAVFAQGLKSKLELRYANQLLTTDEFKQLSDLTAKAAPTVDEKKKIDDLTAESNRRVQEFQTLQQKPNATDAEKAQLAKYQAQANECAASLEDQNKKATDELKAKQVEMSKTIIGEVEAVVAQIAKDRGLTMVFNKGSYGDPGFIMFSSADITDEVLKKLNVNKK